MRTISFTDTILIFSEVQENDSNTSLTVYSINVIRVEGGDSANSTLALSFTDSNIEYLD